MERADVIEVLFIYTCLKNRVAIGNILIEWLKIYLVLFRKYNVYTYGNASKVCGNGKRTLDSRAEERQGSESGTRIVSREESGNEVEKKRGR